MPPPKPPPPPPGATGKAPPPPPAGRTGAGAGAGAAAKTKKGNAKQAASASAAASAAASKPPGAPTGRTTVWTEAEDQQLRSLVGEYGTKKWAAIAETMGTKASKQCRRRWQNYLNAEVTKGGWSAHEDALLIEGHKKFGNRWTEIAKMVRGRTDNAVKNRYMAICKKRMRPPKEKAGSAKQPPPAPITVTTIANGGGGSLGRTGSGSLSSPSGTGSGGSKRAKRKLTIDIPHVGGGGGQPTSVTQTLRVPSGILTPLETATLKQMLPEHFSVDFDGPPSKRQTVHGPQTTETDMREMKEVMGWLLSGTPTPGNAAGSAAGSMAVPSSYAHRAMTRAASPRGGMSPLGGGTARSTRGALGASPLGRNAGTAGAGAGALDSTRSASAKNAILQKLFRAKAPITSGDGTPVHGSPVHPAGARRSPRLAQPDSARMLNSPQFTPGEMQLLLNAFSARDIPPAAGQATIGNAGNSGDGPAPGTLLSPRKSPRYALPATVYRR